MSDARIDDPPVTIAAFDRFLDSQDECRWELVDGRIMAMTNPTARHEQVVSNLGLPMKLAADKRGCQLFYGGLRIQRSTNVDATDKPRPDLIYRCGPLPSAGYIVDPLVICEVLSPSTMDYNRGEKLRFYKRLPTLVHIVLVYQDQARIEHDRKTENGWERDTLVSLNDSLVLDAVPVAIPLEQIYFGVDLPAR